MKPVTAAIAFPKSSAERHVSGSSISPEPDEKKIKQ